MTYDAKILADSLSPAGVRLTTMQITFPRFALAEFNTHRAFSRSSASSRAIPVEKRIAAVRAAPFHPEAIGANQRGMQAGENLGAEASMLARRSWQRAADACTDEAEVHRNLGAHKQHANRLIELWSWHTVIVTATDWRNFFALRCSPMAQPEIREIADRMQVAMHESSPRLLPDGHWHLPLVVGIDHADVVISYNVETAAKISAARCARVSYLTHEGKRDLDADIALADRLASDGHLSPFEHVARPATAYDGAVQMQRIGIDWTMGRAPIADLSRMPFGNLRGWCSLRWTMPGEAVFGGGEP